MHPVTGKEQLILRHHGALKAQHDINPRTILFFHQKLRISGILATTVRNSRINNRDFSVIAQIKTAGQ